MLNSKVSGDIAFGSDVAMSANATKVYIDRLLKNYALTDSSVGIKDLNDAGTAHRGVYVDAEGFIKPTDIIVRGNKTTEADPLILIPVKLPDGSWAFDSLRKSKLGKGANQTYTVSIKQTPNQIITVTTSDGTKHTSDFTVKVGTTWTATVDADTGYNAGKLIASSGTVNGSTTVSATEATIKTFDFNITQSAHQTITVTTGDGVKHTSSFVAKYGTTWTAQVVADRGGNSGDSSETVLPSTDTILNYYEWTDNDNSPSDIITLRIPDNVRVVKVDANMGQEGIEQMEGRFVSQNGIYWVDIREMKDDYIEKPKYIGVTPGGLYTFEGYSCATNHAINGGVSISYSQSINEHTPDIEDYISGSGSSSGSDVISGFKVGNLIVNGMDTGSTTGSGTVTGTVNVSAKAVFVGGGGTGGGSTVAPPVGKFDGCKWEYIWDCYNGEHEESTFIDRVNGYFKFITCSNTKYIAIIAGGNLEELEDTGSCSVGLLNSSFESLDMINGELSSDDGYGFEAHVLVEVSPNTTYYAWYACVAENFGIGDSGLTVLEVDPKTVTISEDGKSAKVKDGYGILKYGWMKFYKFL